MVYDNKLHEETLAQYYKARSQNRIFLDAKRV